MDSVHDTIGRQLDVNVHFASKRIMVIRSGPSAPRCVLATFDVKQALKLTAILTNAVRHIVDPHVDAGS